MKLARRILSAALVGTLSLTMLTACGGMTQTQLEQYIKEKGYITREEAESIAAQNSGSGSSGGRSSAGTSLSYADSRLAAAAKQLSASQWQFEYSGYAGPAPYMMQAMGASFSSVEGVKTVIAKSGNKYYIKTTAPSGETLAVLNDGETTYVLEYVNEKGGINLTKSDGIAVKMSSDESGYEYVNSALNMMDTTYNSFAPKSEDVLSIEAGKMTYQGKEYYMETAKVWLKYAEVGGYTTLGEAVYAFEGNSIKYVISNGVTTLTKYSSAPDSSLFQLPDTVMTLSEYRAAYIDTNTQTEQTTAE